MQDHINPNRQNDPYTPPPRHKEKGGAVVRAVMVAALLGGAALAYSHYSSRLPAADVQIAELEPNLRQDGSYEALPLNEPGEPIAQPAEETEEAPAPAPLETPAQPIPEQW